ncbi:MAG TPA: tRNA (adenosine(37)-N6)-threonylcarbamoyltransferase complex transferase subunit TsaD [Alphaproteobacteria bacterium]|nr:tRNA (adenosine(37)-N6)-threonylcarbamoyltransferase complex transferase subunit TsaD [Alphaproteobacteria bacterium]
MIVLGIETSCDETAAAVVSGDGEILANEVLSQIEDHRPFGGVVPEIAARAHLVAIDAIIRRAMDGAGVGFNDLSAVAATGGPGLIGGLMVGVMTAKAVSQAANVPFIAVNHLEGHALTVRLTAGDSGGNAGGVDFPYLPLLVSGGHCRLLAAKGVGDYKRLGATVDDAAGEAFDKAAKMLGLGYPGGPLIEAAAEGGNGRRFGLPRPMKGRAGCDFSFSGLKTALRRAILDIPGGALSAADVPDLAASFQDAVADVLVDRTRNAIRIFGDQFSGPVTLAVVGGVAANGAIRARLGELAANEGARLIAPPVALCTDNAAMIAWAGVERLKLGLTDGLDFAPRPRWPLDPNPPSGPR